MACTLLSVPNGDSLTELHAWSLYPLSRLESAWPLSSGCPAVISELCWDLKTGSQARTFYRQFAGSYHYFGGLKAILSRASMYQTGSSHGKKDSWLRRYYFKLARTALH